MPDSPQQIAEKINAAVEKQRDQIIADTTRIIQFRTVSGGSEAEEKEYQEQIPECFEWLGERARSMGFEFKMYNGTVGEISWKHPDASAPIVGIAGHIDVVTARGEWTHPPFSGEVADGQLWGRGTQDDKGPVIQALYAMHACKQSGIQPPCTVNLIVGSKEETSVWDDIEDYLRDATPPDFGFTPDADFPIINGEKGMISVVFTANWQDQGIDAETGMEFVSLVGGERENIVPGACEIAIRFPREHKTEVMKELVRTTTSYVVENEGSNITLQPNKERAIEADRYESVISFIGKSAHASTPQEGHNAIVDALKFLKDIETFPAPVRQFCAFLHLAGETTNGEALGLDLAHDFIGETTACLSIAEVRPDKGSALLNVRPTMGLSIADTLQKCRDAAGAFTKATGMPVEITQKGDAKEAIHLDADDPKVAPFIKALQQGFELVTGQKGELRAIGGTTYAKAFPNFCAFGPSLDEPDLIHQVDERTPVEAIIRNVRIFGTSLALLSVTGLGK